MTTSIIIIIISSSSSSSSRGKLGLLKDLSADHWWSIHKLCLRKHANLGKLSFRQAVGLFFIILDQHFQK